MPPEMLHGALIPVMTVTEAGYPPPTRLSPRQTHNDSQSPRTPACNVNSETRNLPSREVTDGNFDEAYETFIFYCNPSIPVDTNTTELKKIFRAPPKSDGKSFSTFTLFELIRKLESKEIKTWAQLALDLGVEPPALDKGQSSQKVQQYAVRLKRWMHAMHVDAFFEYLLAKAHVYWTQVPTANEPTSDFGRDGVAAEEDLALRALLPDMRPKRGRRKAEDREGSDVGKSPSQRPRLDSPALSEDFMLARSSLIADQTPTTAHPGFRSFDRMAPWSATEVRGAQPQTFRWPPPEIAQTPLSAYPQSAITPRTQLWNESREPHSAITPKSRARRRHGPAVSSAWPSNGSTLSGKLRGRPPRGRAVIDGPFSTFPVNPGSRDITTINLKDNTPTATPIIANTATSHFFPAEVRIAPPNPPQNGRPSGLSLQVPQRQGGTVVRLATPPPPVVLINGQGDTQRDSDPLPTPQHAIQPMEYFSSPADQAPNIQNHVSIAFRQNEDTDRTNIDHLESHFICEILAAEWYNGNGESIEKCSIDEADKICKQVIENLQSESSSTEAFLINLSALAGGPLMTRPRMTRVEQDNVSYYECHWKMKFGSIEGNFTIRATIYHDEEPAALEHGPEKTEESWKKRYLDLRQQVRERDARVAALKIGVMDALVGSNQFASI